MFSFHFFLSEKSNVFFTMFIVRPKSPKLQVTDIKTRQLDLTFKLDLHLHYFPPGFVSETYYKSEYNPHWIQSGQSKWLNASFEEFSETIENLHPFTNYDVKIRIKSNATNDTETEMWSDFSASSATTVSDVPQNPPQTATFCAAVFCAKTPLKRSYFFLGAI